MLRRDDEVPTQLELSGVQPRAINAAPFGLQAQRTVDLERFGQQRHPALAQPFAVRRMAASAVVGARRDLHAAVRVGHENQRARELLRLRGAARDVRDDAVAPRLALRGEAVDHADRQLHQQGEEQDDGDLPDEDFLHTALGSVRGMISVAMNSGSNMAAAGRIAGAARPGAGSC